tara:strand:- start:432 stop:1205 length:774 start_codon:yes stop_codon:yes gene_type:complete
MLTVLSPAKKLSKECVAHTENYDLPQFINDSEGLVKQLKTMEPRDLMSLMGISENLAILNWERMQNWSKSFKPNNSRESVYSFLGDTYAGLDANSLSKNDLQFSQKNTRILSGLYGILKPLDLIKPYRLEMGTRMKNDRGRNLYDYWNDVLAKSLNQELKNHTENTIINCASVEYFKSIDRPILDADIITPQFKEMKNGKLKMISFFAKKARGMMARFIIQNRINNADGILAFNLGGYSYDASISTPFDPVFTRSQA